MADEEIVVVRETEGNPSHREASDREDDLGGGQAMTSFRLLWPIEVLLPLYVIPSKFIQL